MRISSRLQKFSKGSDNECILRQIEILACAFYADIFFVSVLVDVVRDHCILAVRISCEKFVATETPHVYDDVTLRFDNIIGPAYDFISIMWTDIVSCVDKPCSSWTKKKDTFFQSANSVGVATCPAYNFFRPLEMYDIIIRIRLPKLFCGTRTSMPAILIASHKIGTNKLSVSPFSLKTMSAFTDGLLVSSLSFMFFPLILNS